MAAAATKLQSVSLLLLLCGRAALVAAGCSATGVTGIDNAADCAALLAAYAAWGNQPTSWASGIAAGASYCSWDAATIQQCADGRVSTL